MMATIMSRRAPVRGLTLGTLALTLGTLALTLGAAAAQEPEPEEAQAEVAAPAGPRERLDELFASLAGAEPREAPRIQARIAEIWSASGSDSMDFLLRRGRDAMDEEAYDKAVEHLTALVTLAPDFAEGWNARATAHYQREEYWLAVADIEQTLAREPRHFGALSGLGVILERTGDEAGALRALRAALAVNPHLPSAREAVERLAPNVDGRDI